MRIKTSTLATLLISFATCAATSARVVTLSYQSPPAAAGAAYVGAEACRSCHADIYDSWQKTKHARTIDRLSSSEQKTECIRCHITGSPQASPVLKNVQCEACHGSGAAHAADQFTAGTIVKKPESPVCESCHNASSPRFRGFVYVGMAKLVHALPKK